MQLFRSLLIPLVLAFSSVAATAQIPLSGQVSDQTGHGPLLSGVVYHVVGNVEVPLGHTLTAQPGAIVKVEPLYDFAMLGTLNAQGTPGNEIIFTSIRDDSAGGDTNNDGPSAGSPGDWNRLYFTDSSDTSVLTHAELRYAGGTPSGGNPPAILAFSADIHVADTLIRDCFQDGINLGADVNGSVSASLNATIERCTIDDCGGDAIRGVTLEMLPNLLDNTGSGNGGNWVYVEGDQNVDVNLVVGPRNGFGDVFRLTRPVNIADPNGTFTVLAGTIMKMQSFVRGPGSLICQGTAGKPVVFTSEADDTQGGDSNGDGAASAPIPGDWFYLTLNANSDLDHALLRYGGGGGSWPSLIMRSGTPTITDSVVEHGAMDAIQYQGLIEPGAGIVRCNIRDNAGEAIVDVRPEWVTGLLDNVATGNGKNWVRVLSFTSLPMSTPPVWGPENGIDETLYVPNATTIPSNVSLTLKAGLIVKMSLATAWSIQGGLFIQGTEADPVVFTDIRDDEYGGDTNNDGSASVPEPGGWAGFTILPTSGSAQIEHLVARYGGRFNPAFKPGMIVSQSANARLFDVRLERSAGSGLEIHAADVCERICSTDNAQAGVALATGTDVTIRKLTAASNGEHGVYTVASSGFTGEIVDSIAWDNPLGAWTNIDAGEVRFSNGDPNRAGNDGNIFTDPLFVDSGAGDYALQAGSPCLDAGDPVSPLDPDGTRADMGCKYRDGCTPAIYCTDQTGICPVTLELDGSASASDPTPFWIRVHNAPANKIGLFIYSKGSPTQPIPIAWGNLCIGAGPKRAQVTFAGGSSGCDGIFEYDFNAWIQGGSDAGLVEGAGVVGQYWYRESGNPNRGALSAATRFAICP